MGDEIEELVAAVEVLRARDFPDLDADLVRSILDIHQRQSEDRAEAKRRTELRINQWVATQPTAGES